MRKLLTRRHIAIVLAGTAFGAMATSAANAQTEPAVAQEVERSFNIPAGPLDEAIQTWSRQSGRSIFARNEDVAKKRTRGVRGRMTADQALTQLLEGSGPWKRLVSDNGAVALVPGEDAEPQAGNVTADILVTGKKSWSLNTGIKRTQDDSQPFIVLSGDEIRRSGAPSLDAYLRDQLSVNSSPISAEQSTAPNATPNGSATSLALRGQSNINLRGLGTRDTLILIDGRRQPGINTGDGTLTQTSITGIPLASIERIEVLASSASGIYGSGASGGVINIVLKRDFTGGELALNYDNTTDFSMGGARVDLTYGMPLEGGRTRLSVTGSWRKANPLLWGDRYFLAEEARAELLANNPTAYISTNYLPYGNAINFRNSGTALLRLKPAYGGTTLATNYGTVLPGYRGIAVDGLAGLLSGLGQFNTEQPDSATSQGRQSPMLFGSERFSGSLTLRREFNSWLTAYIGATGSRRTSTTTYQREPALVTLSAASRFNPFTTAILVALPGKGLEYQIRNDLRTLSAVGGAIVRLPYEWQAAVDLSYATSWFAADIRPPSATAATLTSLRTGGQDILRDVSISPLNIAYDDVPFGTAREPGNSSTFSPSFRMSGPVPIHLPGGRPRIALNAEYNGYRIDGVASTFLSGTVNGNKVASFRPTSTQKTWSAYGELTLPLIGVDNNIPLFREFELRFAARGEWYRGQGANAVDCSGTITLATLEDPFVGCPPASYNPVYSETRRARIDPSVSLRWFPIKDIMLRGSYTSGYLPPQLNQLVKEYSATLSTYGVIPDPLRPNTFLPAIIGGYTGGNPNVRPEYSKTFSAGTVLTPQFLKGLRFSADWTAIRKRDVYFDPSTLYLFGFIFGNATARQAFAAFAAANPDRFTRATTTDGSIGTVTALDLSLINLTGMSTDTIDFTLDYSHDLFGGTIDLGARATHVMSLKIDSFPTQTVQEYAGVVTSGFATGVGNGALRWRGSGSVRWTKGPLMVGWQSRFLDRYKLNIDGSVVAGQGSPYVASQLYHDVSLSYEFPFRATLTAGINNLFDKKPPLDATASPLFYSAYSDPRLRNFYLGMRKAF